MRRRDFLAAWAGFVAMLTGGIARAQSREFTEAFSKLAGDAKVQPGRVTLEIPRLADNGNSVPLKVRVESPMSAADHVTSITLLSDRNPRPVLATFRFGPRAGHPVVSTRVRLNGSQRVTAIARMSDGSLWSAQAPVEVTESACLDAS
jgi:sulfur-oxidizing protein SoxY